MPIKGILLFVALLGSLPVCFVRPFYGILVWTVIAFVNPQSSLFYWSAALSFPWAVAVAIPTIAGMLIFPNRWSNLASPKVFLIAVIWAWFTLTSIVSTGTPLFFHHSADTWAQWRFISKVLLMTGVMIVVVNSFERLQIFVRVLAGCFGLYVLKSIPFIIMTGGAFRLYGPEHSMIADNNDFGLALNMTLPLFFFLAQTEEKEWVRWLCGFLFLMTIPAIFFTYSRGALVGLTAVLMLMLLRLKQRIVIIPVILLAFTVAILFAPAAWRDRMDPSQGLDNSARERLNAWTFSWNLASEYPIAGGGFATFTPELFSRYAPTANDVRGPHSVYFQLLAEHGFVGLGLYLILVLSCLMTTRQLVRLATQVGDRAIANYANMFGASLVGFLVSGLFLGRAYFDYFFTIVACLVILERVARQEWSRDAAEGIETAEEFSGPAFPQSEAALWQR
jgi:putative inorganic carbon (HCO3(-)) transporter